MIYGELTKRILSSVVLLPIMFFIIIKGTYYFNTMIILFFFISVYEWIKLSKNKIYKLPGIFFLIFSFYSVYEIRINMDNGHVYLLFITMICVATDVGGFLFGKIFKGPKLTKISPNKTYSGMLGSFVFTILFIILFLKYLISKNLYELTIEIVGFSFLLSIASQFGDIIISYFKRLSNVKDTGKIIPGHGGLLDRIDGMIFAFPLSYIFLSLLSINFF